MATLPGSKPNRRSPASQTHCAFDSSTLQHFQPINRTDSKLKPQRSNDRSVSGSKLLDPSSCSETAAAPMNLEAGVSRAEVVKRNTR
jgi:hypothetical protein